MADPRGFLKVRQRETQPRRPVPVRIMDWKEVYEAQEKGVLKSQAGRCMDCGVPFCHQGCPLGNFIPEWNDLVWRDKGEEAMERLHATNNFPEFTGRLCPAPCEASCVLGINQPAVTIKQVEVSIVDQAFENGWVNPLPPARLLENFDDTAARITKVLPRDYAAVLQTRLDAIEEGLDPDGEEVWSRILEVTGG